MSNESVGRLIDSNAIVKVDYDNNCKYLFSDQIDRIKKLCAEFDNKNNQVKSNNYGAIGLIGERGSGKSSFLYTARTELTKEGYYVLDVMDPNVFNDTLSFAEIFISNLYNTLSKKKYDKAIVDPTRVQLNSKLKEIANLISDMKGGKESFYTNNTNFNLLTAISSRVDFAEKIKEFIDLFIGLIKKYDVEIKHNKIVIMIDDMDLISSDIIYNTLEDVRKYFCENAIVIVAYRDTQLINAVIESKLKDNEELLNRKIIAIDEIKEQAAKYIEKLFPLSTNVNLYSSEELLSRNQEDVLRAFGIKGGTDSMKETLFKDIYKKTRISLKPVDEREDNRYLLPNNLRGILQLYSVASEMQKVEYEFDDKNMSEEKKDEKRLNISKVIIENLKTLKKYLISAKISQLENKDRILLQDWLSAKVSEKNYLMWKEFYKRTIGADVCGENVSYEASEKLKAYLKDIPVIEPQNIQFGDVYEKLEEYKDAFCVTDYNFHIAYLIKVFYSIELLEQYLRFVSCRLSSSGGNENTYLDNYYLLMNGKIIPDNYYYFSPNSKDFRGIWGELLFKTYDKLDGLNEGNYRKVVQSLVYSSYGARSKINIKATKNTDELQFSKFIKLYEDEEKQLTYGRNYNFEIFSFLCKKEYIAGSVEQNWYIFYSVFDIDNITRISFGERNEYNPYEIFEKIKDNLLINKSEQKRFGAYWNDIKTNIFKENKEYQGNYDIFHDDLKSTLEYICRNLIKTTSVIQAEVLNSDDLANIVNALGKIIYKKTYNAIVEKINNAMKSKDITGTPIRKVDDSSELKDEKTKKGWIDILINMVPKYAKEIYEALKSEHKI